MLHDHQEYLLERYEIFFYKKVSFKLVIGVDGGIPSVKNLTKICHMVGWHEPAPNAPNAVINHDILQDGY